MIRCDMIHAYVTQDEINKELDEALEEAAFNEDITVNSTVEDIKSVLSCMVRFTEEQWLLWANHCMQVCIENSMREGTKTERVQ